MYIAGSKKKDRDRGDNNGAGAKFLWHHQQCVCVCVGRRKQCRLCAKMDKRVKKKKKRNVCLMFIMRKYCKEKRKLF